MYTYFNKIIKIRNKKYQQFFMKDLTKSSYAWDY